MDTAFLKQPNSGGARGTARRAFITKAAAFGLAAVGAALAPKIALAEPAPAEATASRTAWRRAVASAYGPGLYGNRTASGTVLTSATIGVAHRSLPFGTLLVFSAPGHRPSAPGSSTGDRTCGGVHST